SDNSSYQKQAANQEYCVPGDSTSCAGPVGEWHFNEKTGTSVNDTSGEGNTLTWSGSTSNRYTAGKLGAAGQFASTNDIASDTSISSNLSTTNLVTLEAWFYATSWGGESKGTIITQDSAGGPFYWKLEINNDASGNDRTIRFAADWDTDGLWTTPTDSISLNKWYHVAVTYDDSSTSNNPSIYINGVKQTVTTETAPVGARGSAQSEVDIGNRKSLLRYFVGNIDEVKVFDYIRSAAQIAWDYNRGGPTAWWKLDDCTGSTVFDSALNGNGNTNGNTGTVSLGGSGTTTVGTCTTSSSFWGGSSGTGAGKINYAPTFDGTDDYVSATLAGGASRSVSLWFKAASNTGTKGIFQWASSLSDTTPFMLIQDDAGTLKFYTYGAGGVPGYFDTSKTITTDTWYHVVMTFDGTTWKSYVNGSQSGTATAGAGGNSASVYIGNGYNGYFNGQIDDVRVYNYALTPAQVKTIMNDGAAIRYAPITGAPL